MKRLTARLATAGLVLASMLVAVLLAEGVARLAVNPADFLHAKPVEDPILGLRFEALTTGHDALGFRNPTVPARASIVAIGDSVTYGVPVPREASWPQQLAGLLGEPVYNMGLLGFGPLQYLHLAQNVAPALKPRLLIVGLYLGNDLMDAYNLPRSRPHWQAWRVSAAPDSGATAFDVAGQSEPKKRFESLRNWLSRNSVLYSMLRLTVFQPFAAREQDQLAQGCAPDMQMLWRDPASPGVRTIFTPAYRLAAVDLELQAVSDGMAITQKAFAALKAEGERQGVQLLVLLIPTKERAYCGYLRKSGERMPESYSKLCVAEARASAELQRFMTARGIVHLDVTPALESHIEQHEQLYPPDSDGHPHVAGYRVIAQEAALAVRRMLPKH